MSDADIVSSFVEGAPPGELASVIADIESLTISKPRLTDDLAPAFAKYNEDQFTTVQLPGSAAGSQPAIVSVDSRVDPDDDSRYYDPSSATSFAFDHRTQKASAAQSHAVDSDLAYVLTVLAPRASHLSLVVVLSCHVVPSASTLKSLATYVKDHFERPAFGVYPIDNGARIAILIVSNKYSPQNFWNGRWRSRYVFDPSTGSLEGTIRIDVHYYEDGNVRLLTDKPQSATVAGGGSGSGSGAALAREIASLEKAYQEELNKKFLSLSEGAFKGLRRQLPVTRQKIEWDKVASYRLGQDIGGGASGRR
ncbi:capping protein (actin filament) muscle Z-line, alpha [Sporothrix schenckii 1099-18]|uniref:F-actin-capping protein subunit alpha n=1 Tax=Sporothrix schenckii 1099-18 TaxID=1397361 RepID=A0A0F2M9F7_SPOSC|nr:capping protein (actin filament) muscle Z-line, alpha [Sporothrix schenckii 1099-18]KJR85719.1 capping protein (actin filament) muscle Z-line, alpha [Sporothrix schenckii 1099-18]